MVRWVGECSHLLLYTTHDNTHTSHVSLTIHIKHTFHTSSATAHWPTYSYYSFVHLRHLILVLRHPLHSLSFFTYFSAMIYPHTTTCFTVNASSEVAILCTWMMSFCGYIFRLLPPGANNSEGIQSTLDPMVKNVYTFGRDWIASQIAQRITHHQSRQLLETELLTLWDSLYDSWVTRVCCY